MKQWNLTIVPGLRDDLIVKTNSNVYFLIDVFFFVTGKSALNSIGFHVNNRFQI